MIVAQIALIDVVFSIDSIVTAIGMAEHVGVMIAAVVFAVAVMYVASGPVAGFIDRHPTTRMLALAFLLMIGLALVADGARLPHPARLPLRGDGVLGGGRDPQRDRQAQSRQARGAQARAALARSGPEPWQPAFRDRCAGR